MALSPDQLAAIDRHLRKENWLLNESLIAELTDHYANATADLLAQGISFELALVDVQKAFGGRKGLLKMEEEFGITQYRSTIRLTRQLFKSYFRLPRLRWTVSLFVFIYGIAFNWHLVKPFVPQLGDWSFVALMTGIAVLYFWSFFRLANPETLISDNVRSWQPGVFIGQGTVGLSSLIFFANALIPANWFWSQYPLPVTLGVTLALLWEAACFEVIFQTARKHQFKPA
jgi:hypothetical protein